MVFTKRGAKGGLITPQRLRMRLQRLHDLCSRPQIRLPPQLA